MPLLFLGELDNVGHQHRRDSSTGNALEETQMSATAIANGVESKNMRLIGHSDLGGFGNGGEGMGLQKTRDGRRIMYIAHECAPINFSVVDVTDPSKPHLVTQTKLPHAQVRSNSLD